MQDAVIMNQVPTLIKQAENINRKDLPSHAAIATKSL